MSVRTPSPTLHHHRYSPDGAELEIEDIPHDELPWLSEVIEETQRLTGRPVPDQSPRSLRAAGRTPLGRG